MVFRWLGRFRNLFSKSRSYDDVGSDEKRERLEAILGFSPSDLLHYDRALRHRSIIDDDRYESFETYERLEFLGDAVLDLIVTEVIFSRFPEGDEGFLTKLRAKIVRGDTLSDLAKSLDLQTILEIGERARGQGIELSNSVLSDLFESLVAAIYLTEGYPVAFRFVERVLTDRLDLEEVSVTVDNFKSELLEYTQALKLPLPKYRVVSESGPGHDKTFQVAVSIAGSDYGTGTGKSKKRAEQIAARRALESLDPERES